MIQLKLCRQYLQTRLLVKVPIKIPEQKKILKSHKNRPKTLIKEPIINSTFCDSKQSVKSKTEKEIQSENIRGLPV